jgi:sulfatase modifying factor 1
VPAAMFPQGRSTVAGASDYYPGGNAGEYPEFPSTVSAFALDKYEVTVGRFRKYVAAYVSNTASAPVDGAGANPNVPGSGWQSAWNAYLPATPAVFIDTAHLNCYLPYQTWTDTVLTNEIKALSCVSWYEAFAFCIWDGGRLATESEWEYAAAGGTDNRLYPWGAAAPDCAHANYSPVANTTWCGPGGVHATANVGSYPAGNGRWGHADLAGNVYEWVFDWNATYPTGPNTNYANLVATSGKRGLRGGTSGGGDNPLRAAYRGSWTPDFHFDAYGLRCARNPQ